MRRSRGLQHEQWSDGDEDDAERDGQPVQVDEVRDPPAGDVAAVSVAFPAQQSPVKTVTGRFGG